MTKKLSTFSTYIVFLLIELLKTRDIINTNSKIIALGQNKELTEKAFNKKLDELDSMMLEGVVSRKKQIAPQILEVID